MHLPIPLRSLLSFAFAAASALLLAQDPPQELGPGDPSVQPYLTANPTVSRVGITLSIDAATVERELKARLPVPLVQGRTPELGFLLHADEAVTVEELQQVLVTPAREAYEEIQRVPRTITRTVKVGTRAVGCAITFWKWGTCWEDVWEEVKETVWDEVRVRVEAVAAVYKEALVPVIRLQQAIVPIKGDFEYVVSLRDLKTTFEGHHLRAVADLDVRVRANVYLDHLPAAITPRGNTDFTFRFRAVQQGTLRITPDGGIATDGMATTLELVEVQGTDLIVDLIDLGASTVPVTDLLLDEIGRRVDHELTERVNDLVKDKTSAFNVKEKATAFVRGFDRPVPLTEGGHLYPNITGVFVSTPSGAIEEGANVLRTKVGLTFQPYATFSEIPAPAPGPQKPVHFGTELVDADRLDVVLPSFLSYGFIAAQLQPLLDAFNEHNADAFIAGRYVLQVPTAAYGGDNTVALSAAIHKRNGGAKVGDVRLKARLYTVPGDTTVCVDLLDVDLGTRNVLLWLLEPLVRHEMQDYAAHHSCRSVAKEVREAGAKVDEALAIRTDHGRVEPSGRTLGITDITALPDHLLLRVSLRSDLRFVRTPAPLIP